MSDVASNNGNSIVSCKPWATGTGSRSTVAMIAAQIHVRTSRSPTLPRQTDMTSAVITTAATPPMYARAGIGVRGVLALSPILGLYPSHVATPHRRQHGVDGQSVE